MNPKVSIIIPIYNVEIHLDKCISSIINQTYQNIEIILINDGSTDGSENICLKYASFDQRIKYFYKQNGGLSSARNFGLNKFSGDYVLFVDSDDSIALNTIKLLIELVNKHQLKVLEFKSSRVEENKSKETNELKIQNYNEAAKRIIQNGTFFAWNKLYHSSIIEEVFFIENQIYEDILFTFNTFYRANKIGFLDSVFYYYNEDNVDSLSRSKYSLKQLDQLKSYEQTIDFVKNNDFDKEVIQGLNNRLAFFYMNNFLNLTEFEKYDKNYDKRKEIKNKLQILNHSNSNLNIKILKLLPLRLVVSYFKIRSFLK